MIVEGPDGVPFEECYQMSNGCICCSVKDDLVLTLERIMQRRDLFDYVLVGQCVDSDFAFVLRCCPGRNNWTG